MKQVGTLILVAASCYAQSPIVCNRNAFTTAERQHHVELGRKLRAATVEIREAPRGLLFRLSSGIRLTELADWIEAERKCCPFLDVAIKLECEGGPVELTLSGRDGVKQLLIQEFGIGPASGPAE